MFINLNKQNWTEMKNRYRCDVTFLSWARMLCGATSLHKAGHILSVCPRINSTWQPICSSQLPGLFSFCSSHQAPFWWLTWSWCCLHRSPPLPHFLCCWPSWCSLYLEPRPAPLVPKHLLPASLLWSVSFSWAFQGWSHHKPCSHTVSLFPVISWIVSIWIPFPFPWGTVVSGVCSTQPCIDGWHAINTLWW